MFALEQRYSKNFILLNHVIWWMFSIYLLVDSLTGFSRLYLGQDLKISLLFKLPLLVLLLCFVLVLNRRLALLLMCLVAIFLIAPLRQIVLHADIEYFVLDLRVAIKLLSPTIVFAYVLILANRMPELIEKYLVKSLWFISSVFVLNIGIGLTGVGFRSYTEGENGIGTTGFFFAGNEVGAVLVVIMCFAFQSVWMRSRLYYCVVGLFFIVLSSAIGTKVAILSSLLCFALIPILNERAALFFITKLKLVALFLMAIVVLIISYYFLDVLTNFSVFARLNWAFEQRGIIGFIFSGRQYFVDKSISIYLSDDSVVSYLFGIGVSGTRLLTGKPASEIDPVDTLVWFGLIGLGVMILLSGYFLVKSVKEMANANCVYAPAVVLGNILLISAACFAGHIWTSGMLGISWALLNGLLLLNKPDEKHSKNKLVVALK